MAKKSKWIVFKCANHTLFEHPKFLYDVSIYELSKNSAICLKQKYYETDKYIKVTEYKSVKLKDKLIEKTCTLVGAPMEYIKSNNYKQI